MEITLTGIDLVAWWGAILASIVFLWDIYKWKTSGPKLRVNIRPNMIIFGGTGESEPSEKWILVDVVNKGDTLTTITTVGGFYYKNKCQLICRKPEQAFVVNLSLNQGFPQLPFSIEPGKQWTGCIRQTQDVEKMASEGILMIHVYDAWSESLYPNGMRLNIKKKPPEESLKE